MRLYTKGGDGGETGLFGGARVAKDDRRIAGIGDIDELNAAVGWSAVACDDAPWLERLRTIQDSLFALGAEVADPERKRSASAPDEGDVVALESWIDDACDSVTALTKFVLPGGCELAARFHVARAVCRRAERTIVALTRDGDLSVCVQVYLNRLADLLFAWSRLANARAGVADVEWNPTAKD